MRIPKIYVQLYFYFILYKLFSNLLFSHLHFVATHFKYIKTKYIRKNIFSLSRLYIT